MKQVAADAPDVRWMGLCNATASGNTFRGKALTGLFRGQLFTCDHCLPRVTRKDQLLPNAYCFCANVT